MSDDLSHLRRALELARLGEGATSPNPMVGAIVVLDGQRIAEGYHRRAGEEHAEEAALARAGERARGADLYVTLEPCAHQGRRPPCTDAILKSGVRRVIACIQDPNPLVNGRGFERLRAAGVQVASGFLEEEARRLNAPYLKWIVSGLPFVTLKVASTLDGRLADASGRSRWITGEAARAEVQHLRRQADAILIGVGTALADDPALDVRPPAARKQVLKVVLDSGLRLSPGARLLRDAGADRVRIYTARGAPAARRQELESRGAEIVEVEREGSWLNLSAVLADLARGEILHLLCEGGEKIFTSLLEKRLADRLHLFLAPRLLGSGGRAWLGELGIAALEDAQRLRTRAVRRVGEDVWIEADLEHV